MKRNLMERYKRPMALFAVIGVLAVFLSMYGAIGNLTDALLADIYTDTQAIYTDTQNIYTDTQAIYADTQNIDPEAQKIDLAAVDGLSGISNSLSYKVHETETHLHSYERWFELAATPAAETHIADRIGTGSGAFRIDAGDDDWGSWVQVFGSDDTPSIAGSVYFDFHRIVIESEEKTATYFFQIGFGASGAAALSSGDVTETIYGGPAGAQSGGPVEIQSRRAAAGTKVWARCMCPGENTATIDFFFGIHEYGG